MTQGRTRPDLFSRAAMQGVNGLTYRLLHLIGKGSVKRIVRSKRVPDSDGRPYVEPERTSDRPGPANPAGILPRNPAPAPDHPAETVHALLAGSPGTHPPKPAASAASRIPPL